MERGKRKLELMSQAAELFDLPADVAGGLPHIELIGNCQMLIHSHKGILSYSGETVDVNCGPLIVRITGSGLELAAMTGCEVRIRGKISGLELME